LFKCYRWYLENISDEELKNRGCDSGTIETMKQIHEYVISGRRNRNVIKSHTVTNYTVTRMERMLRGDESDKKYVAAAYQNMIEGKSDSELRSMKFSAREIQKAHEFHELYAHRDMFACVVAREMSVTKASAQKMQQLFRTHNSF
jgi:hypothetical protein